MWEKLYITLSESSVCLSCEYPNIHYRGVTFLLIAKQQEHVYALKLVNVCICL